METRGLSAAHDGDDGGDDGGDDVTMMTMLRRWAQQNAEMTARDAKHRNEGRQRREVRLTKHCLPAAHITNPCKTCGNQRSERNTQRNTGDYDDDPIAIMCLK